jgi:hypothetical protein
MPSEEAYFLVRVRTAETPPGWRDGILKRLQREVKYLFRSNGQVVVAQRATGDLEVGMWKVSASEEAIMNANGERRCGSTGDDCFCACGCGGDDSRCQTWSEAYALRQEVPDWHTCCKALRENELVEMPAEEAKRMMQRNRFFGLDGR